jgi:hypothetical protein
MDPVPEITPLSVRLPLSAIVNADDPPLIVPAKLAAVELLFAISPALSMPMLSEDATAWPLKSSVALAPSSRTSPVLNPHYSAPRLI